ncbi:MAG: HIT family protein [Candidatus Komeilibacteria bacterium]
MTDCLFCSIVSGTIPANKVYEDEQALAFLDIKPVHPGHVLLIPKQHHAQLAETPDTLLAQLFIKAKKLLPAIKLATGADFVVVNVVGTDVPHFHIHLIPRYFNDGFKGWPTTAYQEGADVIMADSIKNVLRS